MSKPDIAYLRKTDGVSPDILASRVRLLADEVDARDAALDDAASGLASMTETIDGLRAAVKHQTHELIAYRAAAPWVHTAEGVFLGEVIEALAAARTKYSGPHSTLQMLAVVTQEVGETAQAQCHSEGSERMREEAAQACAALVRLVVGDERRTG